MKIESSKFNKKGSESFKIGISFFYQHFHKKEIIDKK